MTVRKFRIAYFHPSISETRPLPLGRASIRSAASLPPDGKIKENGHARPEDLPGQRTRRGPAHSQGGGPADANGGLMLGERSAHRVRERQGLPRLAGVRPNHQQPGNAGRRLGGGSQTRRARAGPAPFPGTGRDPHRRERSVQGTNLAGKRGGPAPPAHRHSQRGRRRTIHRRRNPHHPRPGHRRAERMHPANAGQRAPPHRFHDGPAAQLRALQETPEPKRADADGHRHRPPPGVRNRSCLQRTPRRV